MPKIAAVLAAAAALAAAPASAPAAAPAADCGIAPMLPDPEIAASAKTVSAGSTFAVRGRDWTAGCGKVTLRVTAGGRSIQLGTARVRPDGSFALVSAVPDMRSGDLIVSAKQRCDGIASAASVALHLEA